MKLTFFKRMGEKIRYPFRKEIPKTIPVVETAPQPVADNATEATAEESSVIRSADQCGEQARYFLLRNNKPVGKPFSYYHPEIRIVHVGSFVNAFFIFLAYVRSASVDLSPDRRISALYSRFSG